MTPSSALRVAFLALLTTVGAVAADPPASTAPAAPLSEAREYIEVLRSDFNTTKIRTLNEVLKLSEAEAEVFWPLYRKYEAELARVGDRKLALIQEFTTAHFGGTLGNRQADDLAKRWLQNTQDRLDLWKKYRTKMAKALSPLRAAQFLQVEHQLALFVDLSIASEMPAVGATNRPSNSKTP